jgi:hypothetical protein
MRISTASEVLAPDPSGPREPVDALRVAAAGEIAEEEISRPDDRRAIRGVFLGVVLGAGAWGMIWVVVSALWHHRG